MKVWIICATVALAALNAGCSRCESRLSLFPLDDEAAIYEDERGRETKWGISGNTLAAVAERIPKGGALYEPYPMVESFAQVALVVCADGNEGNLAVIYCGGSEQFTVDSVMLDRPRGRLRVEAKNERRQAVFEVTGKESEFVSIYRRAKSLLDQ